MNQPTGSQIHPTAIISPEARLGNNVQIGPYVVIEGEVTIGDGCILRPSAQLIGPLTMGNNNQVFSGAILGEKPQHLGYKDEPTRLEIGDGNIFRENVTVHRGSAATGATIVGNNNCLMACSHIGHDSILGDNCILANNALIAGHCVIHDNVFISGNAVVHQFVTMGRLSMLSGISGSSKDVPPFVIQQGINAVGGVNVVGLRRAGFAKSDIDAIRHACRILYKEGRLLPASLMQIDKELGDREIVQELLTFIRTSKRGINLNWLDLRGQAA